MAGVRLGYGLCADASLLHGMSETVPPWNVSTLAQAAGVAALGETEFLEKTRALVRAERAWLAEQLAALGFRVIPSDANYLLFRDAPDWTPRCGNRGSSYETAKITRGSAPVGTASPCARARKTRRSSAPYGRSDHGEKYYDPGHDVQRGQEHPLRRTVPHFPAGRLQSCAVQKPEHGAQLLHHRRGRRDGRAQVVQAEAAGIAPDVRMNPILLKPTTDVGSQVIVNGVVQGNMHAMEYYRRKREYIPAVMEAYNSLAAENDILVIEGAGSPAEINLKQEDIVNMGLAKLVDAPVLLVGDIDRGGVFAQLYGTVALLEPDERARIPRHHRQQIPRG